MRNKQDNVAGLDIGYGDLKICHYVDNKIVHIKMPTALKSTQMTNDLEPDEYHYHGKQYIFGKRALQGAVSTLSETYIEKYSPLLAYIATSDLQNVKNLAVGLPLHHYDKKREDISKALSVCNVNNKVRQFDIKVFPQGIGVLLDYRMNDLGEVRPYTANNALIVDVGFNTVDIVSVHEGNAYKKESDMWERDGVSKMAVELSKIVRREIGINLSDLESRECLQTRMVNKSGEVKDLSLIVDEVIDGYAEYLFNRLSALYENKIQRFTSEDKVILAGGGACLIEREHITESWRNLVHVPEFPDFANVRGFMKAMVSEQ